MQKRRNLGQTKVHRQAAHQRPALPTVKTFDKQFNQSMVLSASVEEQTTTSNVRVRSFATTSCLQLNELSTVGSVYV